MLRNPEQRFIYEQFHGMGIDKAEYVKYSDHDGIMVSRVVSFPGGSVADPSAFFFKQEVGVFTALTTT